MGTYLINIIMIKEQLHNKAGDKDSEASGKTDNMVPHLEVSLVLPEDLERLWSVLLFNMTQVVYSPLKTELESTSSPVNRPGFRMK